MWAATYIICGVGMKKQENGGSDREMSKEFE